MKVIDLFCGAGGFSEGFKHAGFDIVLGIDFNEHAIKTHHYNFPNSNSLCLDLTTITPESILERCNLRKNEIAGIIGGPPCQGFSQGGKRLIDDPRNLLFLEFVKFVKYIKPSFVLLENVPGLSSMANGAVKEEIINLFSEIGYHIDAKILLATDYGVPQKRERLFFFGLLNEEPSFPERNCFNVPTVGEFLMDLPPLELGEGGDVYLADNNKIVYNHYAFPMKELNKNRLSSIPEGGNQHNLPSSLKRKKFFSSAYRRLNRALPSHTISTHFRDEYLIHPVQDRIITVREAARIQSFPDEFRFFGPLSRKGQFSQVGNAVPPLLSKAWAEHIKKILIKGGNE